MYVVFRDWCQECGTGDIIKAFYRLVDAEKFVKEHNEIKSKRPFFKYKIIEIIPE